MIQKRTFLPLSSLNLDQFTVIYTTYPAQTHWYQPTNTLLRRVWLSLSLLSPSPGCLRATDPGFSEFWADPTLSFPALTVTSSPGESVSSAADSGWRISAMGFCPELARPLGAPTLMLRETAGRGRASEETAARFSAADEVGKEMRFMLYSASVFFNGWDATQLSADTHRAAPEGKIIRTR